MSVRRHARLLLGFLVAAAAAAAAAGSIGPADAATLEGYVRAREGGEPLPSAALRVAGLPLQGESGPDGAFRFRSVPPGSHRLEVRLVGYRPVERTITIASPDTTLVLDVFLEPVAFHLRELV